MTNKNAKKASEQVIEQVIEQVNEEIKNEEAKEMQADQADEPQAPVEEAKEDAQAAQENQEAESAAVSGAALYEKHAAAVNGAKQFYQCKLPSISYYSKRALCEAVDNMKRMCDRSKGNESLDMSVEMLETAAAYLYNRKVNG